MSLSNIDPNKPSIASLEGKGFIGVIMAGVSLMWYLVTRQPPPALDLDTLMQAAKTADQVSEVIKLVADSQKMTNSIDYTKLGEMGSVLGMVCYIYRLFSGQRAAHKSKQLEVLKELQRDKQGTE